MSFDLEEFLQLEARVEKAKAKRQKDKWELEKELKEAQEIYGCSSLEEMEELLEKSEKKAEKDAKEYEQEYNKFMQEFGERL